MNKRATLSSAIDSCSADIIVLTETWLSAKIKSSEIFDCDKAYRTYRYDRDVRIGGGVLVAVNEAFNSSVVPIRSSLEIVCVRIIFSCRDYILCACYRSPAPSPSFCSELHDVLNLLIVRYPNSPLILMGDFNFPGIVWRADSVSVKQNLPENIEFLNLCTDFNLTQLVLEPTRSTSTCSNTLDLVLTTSPDLVSSITYLDGLSDHMLLHFTAQAHRPSRSKVFKIIRDYSRANTALITAEMERFTEEFITNYEERSVNDNWLLFKNKLLSLLNEHVPT